MSHESEEFFVVEVFLAEFDRQIEVLIVGPVRTGRNLIVARLFEIEVELGVRTRFRIEIFIVVPVAHNDRLGRPLEEIGMIPTVVGPNPGAYAEFITLFNEEEKIVFPEFFLSDDDIFESALMFVCFFVVTKVEETRMVKEFSNFFEEVGADLVVGFRGEHSRIIAEPEIMAR